jgi:hypothetical protein
LGLGRRLALDHAEVLTGRARHRTLIEADYRRSGIGGVQWLKARFKLDVNSAEPIIKT